MTVSIPICVFFYVLVGLGLWLNWGGWVVLWGDYKVWAAKRATERAAAKAAKLAAQPTNAATGPIGALSVALPAGASALPIAAEVTQQATAYLAGALSHPPNRDVMKAAAKRLWDMVPAKQDNSPGSDPS